MDKGIIYISHWIDGEWILEKHDIANFSDEIWYSIKEGDYFNIKGLGKLYIKSMYTTIEDNAAFRCRWVDFYEESIPEIHVPALLSLSK